MVPNNPQLGGNELNEEKIFQKANYDFNQQNRLGDNFVRDFKRYECKKMKRYGGGLDDKKYNRQDGS